MEERKIIIPGELLKANEIKNKKGFCKVEVGEKPGQILLTTSGLVMAIYGSATLTSQDPDWKEIIELTQKIFERGGVVINGGEDIGSMLASAQTFPEATLGIVSANLMPSEFGPKVVVEDQLTRVGILSRIPLVTAFKGGVGTIEEWGRALREIKDAYQANLKPPQLFLHNYWKPVFDLLDKSGSIQMNVWPNIHFFEKVDEIFKVIDYVQDLEKRGEI